MNELHFIDYEAKVMLADTVGLRPDTELAHRRLCDFIWAQGRPPADHADTLMEVCRVKEADWARVRDELIQKGWFSEHGTFTHKGCIKTLERCRENHARKLAAARAGNAARWSARNPTVIQPDARPQSDRNPTGHPTAIRPDSQSQSQSQSQLKGGEKAPPLSTSQRIACEKELTRVTAEFSRKGELKDYPKTSKTFERIQELKQRQAELRKILGVVA